MIFILFSEYNYVMKTSKTIILILILVIGSSSLFAMAGKETSIHTSISISFFISSPKIVFGHTKSIELVVFFNYNTYVLFVKKYIDKSGTLPLFSIPSKAGIQFF